MADRQDPHQRGGPTLKWLSYWTRPPRPGKISLEGTRMPVWRLWVVVALVSIGLVLPSAALAAAPTLDWPVPGGRFYTQANGFPLGASPMG